MMSKELDRIKKRYRGKLETEYLMVNSNRKEAAKYGVMYVPTLVFMDGTGRDLAVQPGYMTMENVVKMFRAFGVRL